jgi:hypothetical protein
VTPVAVGNNITYNFTYNKPPATTRELHLHRRQHTTAHGIACFYADPNYTGESFCASADSSWVGSTWNDRISSVKVTAGNKVVLYGDITYGGGSVTLTADTPNLGTVELQRRRLVVQDQPGHLRPWNGMTTFTMVNQTAGRWADSQVYWAIIGKDWNTGNFVHVDANGNLIPMSMSDNGAADQGRPGWANYFVSMATKKSVTIPAINSARIMFSVGSPMYFKVGARRQRQGRLRRRQHREPERPEHRRDLRLRRDGDHPGRPPDPGIFVNTTRVDQFGFPLKLRVGGPRRLRQDGRRASDRDA